jgi:hypothetical protein
MPSPSTIESDAEPDGEAETLPSSPPEAAAEVAPSKERKKRKPVGVEVGERAVAVDGKLVPMDQSEQTPVPWKK